MIDPRSAFIIRRERRWRLFSFVSILVFSISLVLFIKGLLASTVLAFVIAYLFAPIVDFLDSQVMSLKKDYPDVFRLELNPAESVPLSDIIVVMDSVRTTRSKDGHPVKITFTDITTGKPVETNLLFPDITFGNVAGG